MKIHQSVKEYKIVGELEIDLAKAMKLWNPYCFVHQWHDSYSIHEISPKGRKHTRLAISKNQALELIEKLCLVKDKDTLFNNAYIYIMNDK